MRDFTYAPVTVAVEDRRRLMDRLFANADGLHRIGKLTGTPARMAPWQPYSNVVNLIKTTSRLSC